jgi:hypothetical protein
MRIGSSGGAPAAAAALSSVAQWQQSRVATPAPVAVPEVAPTAQLIATLSKGNNVNTYA